MAAGRSVTVSATVSAPYCFLLRGSIFLAIVRSLLVDVIISNRSPEQLRYSIAHCYHLKSDETRNAAVVARRDARLGAAGFDSGECRCPRRSAQVDSRSASHSGKPGLPDAALSAVDSGRARAYGSDCGHGRPAHSLQE